MTRALTTRECSVNLHCHLLFSSPKPEPPRSHPGLPSPIQNVSQSHSVFIALFYLQKTQIKHFNYSLSKLIHFFFFFLAQRNITDGPQDQSETHKIYQLSLVQGQPQDSDRQTDRQTASPQSGKINKVHIHLTVKSCSPTGKGGQERAVSLLQRGSGHWGQGGQDAG